VGWWGRDQEGLEVSVNRELGLIRTAKEDTVGAQLECEDLEEREESVGG
jgi:hypothetical protein